MLSFSHLNNFSVPYTFSHLSFLFSSIISIFSLSSKLKKKQKIGFIWIGFMVFNATFNNITIQLYCGGQFY
jgi:hypothetical protein